MTYLDQDSGIDRDSVAWPYKVLVVLAALAIIGMAVGLCGCTRSAQLEALTVVTKSAKAAAPKLIQAIQEDEAKCFQVGATYDTAKACVDASRAHWAPALAGYDVLEATDQAALDGTIDFVAALGAYCALAAALPALPAAPAALGVCP